MHPRFGVTKTYEVTVRGVVSHAALEKLTRGLFVDGRRTSPAKVEIIYHDKEKTFLKIRIHEGRTRQVRLMLLTVGHPVISLKRTHFGNLTLGTLKEGKCRMLSASEVAGLRRLTGLK
jgi:23S rRNA pseudouridine2605 synthase